MKVTKRIDIKEAVKISKEAFLESFDLEIKTSRLEEINVSEDDKYWLIIASGVIASKRQYKEIKIDMKTGKVISILEIDIDEL